MRSRFVIPGLVAAAMVACGPASVTRLEVAPPVPLLDVGAPIAQIAGQYALVAIDGHQVPYAPVDPDRPAGVPVPEVVASTLSLEANGTFRMTMSYRALVNGESRTFERPFSGDCKPSGNDYEMQWNGAGITPVTTRGDTLFVNNGGMKLAYLRRP